MCLKRRAGAEIEILTSGVPYERLLRKASGESMSYFSAKPKSTRTGTFLLDSSMFAGLYEVRNKTISLVIYLLDVVVNNTASMKKVDPRKQKAKPFSGL